jgi:hypothetical protein
MSGKITDNLGRSSGLVKAADSGGGTNTPNFHVEDNAQQAIGNASSTKLSFQTENYDSDSAFASDKFTVPSGGAGKYYFYGYWALHEGDDFNGFKIYLYKNGGAVASFDTIHDHYESIQISRILELDESDYVEVYAYQNSGQSGNTLGNSEFQGFKLIE